MFRLGQGNAPAYPKEKSDELKEFLDLCFVAEPAERADTTALLNHAFVQVCTTFYEQKPYTLYCIVQSKY